MKGLKCALAENIISIFIWNDLARWHLYPREACIIPEWLLWDKYVSAVFLSRHISIPMQRVVLSFGQ